MPDDKERFDSRGDFPTPTVKHRLPNEVLEMNKYHLLWVLERIKIEKYPSFEKYVFIPFGFFLTGLITLLTTQNFKDVFGFKADIWQSFMVFLTISTGVATIILLCWWIFNKLSRKEKTPLEIVDEIIEQMEKDRENSTPVGSHNDSTQS